MYPSYLRNRLPLPFTVDVTKSGKARGVREGLIIISVKGEVVNQTDTLVGRAPIVCSVSLRDPRQVAMNKEVKLSGTSPMKGLSFSS